MKQKKRIAFFCVGIFGNDDLGPKVPSLSLLLNNLATKFDLVVYRLSKGKTGTQDFKIRSMPLSFLNEKINFALLAVAFVFDHLQKRYSIINAISARPSGRLAVALGKIFNIPVVLHLHASEAVTMQNYAHGDILDAKAKKLTQQICNSATRITALTHFQMQIINESLSPSVPVKIIHHGCDTSLFSFKKKETTAATRILYVGYNHQVKNPIGAIKVFSFIIKKIKATLTVVGDGLNQNTFEGEDLSTQNVRFLGQVPYSQMADIFQSHDVLLVTSIYESQSSVAIEAMASGVLVCGTAVGILADLSGYACIAANVNENEALANEIVNLIGNPERQNELRSNARQWTEKYDHLWTLGQYEQLFDSIVK